MQLDGVKRVDDRWISRGRGCRLSRNISSELAREASDGISLSRAPYRVPSSEIRDTGTRLFRSSGEERHVAESAHAGGRAAIRHFLVKRPYHACSSQLRARAATCHSWAIRESAFRGARTTTWRSTNARWSPCATMVRCRHPLTASDTSRGEGAHGRLTRDRAAHTSHFHHETCSASAGQSRLWPSCARSAPRSAASVSISPTHR
jgi:hypothetical protein